LGFTIKVCKSNVVFCITISEGPIVSGRPSKLAPKQHLLNFIHYMKHDNVMPDHASTMHLRMKYIALAKWSTLHMVYWVEKDIWNEQHGHFRPSWVVHLCRHLVILTFTTMWISCSIPMFIRIDINTSPIVMTTLNTYWEIQAIWVRRCLLCRG
jgi:hypothetical protein